MHLQEFFKIVIQSFQTSFVTITWLILNFWAKKVLTDAAYL